MTEDIGIVSLTNLDIDLILRKLVMMNMIFFTQAIVEKINF